MKIIALFICLIIFTASCKSCGDSETKTDSHKEKAADKLEPYIDEKLDKNSSIKLNNPTKYEAILKISPDGKGEYIKKSPSDFFRKTKSGLEYRFIERNIGNPTPKVGDVIILHLKYKSENDSLIFDSNNVDEYFRMRVQQASHPGGCIEEAYLMMNEGDSAEFKINAENFYTYTQNRINLPDYVKKDEKLTFYMRLKQVLSSDDFVRKHSDIYRHQMQKENSLIQRFLMQVDEEYERFDSGLVYIKIEEGRGEKIKPGNTVEMHYTASFIDGGVFDSTHDREEPFEFTAGREELIPGLEEGIANMKNGEIAVLIIPFRLAYGDEKTGIIPPFSTLIFEIKITNVR